MTEESCFMVEFGFSFLFFVFSFCMKRIFIIFLCGLAFKLSGVVSWCLGRCNREMTLYTKKRKKKMKKHWTTPTSKHKSEPTSVSATPTNTAPFSYVSVNWDRPPHRRLRVLLFTNGVNFLYVQGLCMWDGLTVYRRCPIRLESLTVCKCHYKGRPSSTVISRAWVLVRPGSKLAPFRSEAWHISNWANEETVFFQRQLKD